MNSSIVPQTVESRRIPFSELEMLSFKLAEKRADLDLTDGPDLLVTLGVLGHFGIPCNQYFFEEEENCDRMILPDSVREATPVGVIIAIGGALWVVVEVSKGESMWLASADHIDITK